MQRRASDMRRAVDAFAGNIYISSALNELQLEATLAANIDEADQANAEDDDVRVGGDDVRVGGDDVRDGGEMGLVAYMSSVALHTSH
jgi:hypothetical protein